MKKLVVMSLVLLVPTAAHAGFSMKETAIAPAPVAAPAPTVVAAPVEKVTTITRVKARPALEIINERYVPDDIKKKYSMPDDYFEMTKPATVAPIVKAEPAPVTATASLPLPAPVAITPVQAAPIQTPPAPAAAIAAQAPMDIASIQPAMPMPTPVVIPAPKALVVEDAVKAPPPIPVPAERVDTWRARKGESMRDILKRWSDRAGTEFVWTAAESPKITDEFSYMGTFQDATTKLMAKNAGQLKMKFADEVPADNAPGPFAAVPPMSEPVPLADATPSYVPPAMETPVDDMRVTDPALELAPAKPGDMTWFASSGASLEAVLRAWAETEGASIVWQADQGFAVRKAMSKKGMFEDALAQILTQYDGQKLRPVGQLYKNPISGEKVLVIRTDKG